MTYNLDSIFESDNSKATFKLYGDTQLTDTVFTAMVWIDATGHQISVTVGDDGLVFDLDMTGQTQSADNEMAHLENYDLITAHITSEDQLSNINFTSQGALLTFDITNIPSSLGTPDSLYFLAMGSLDNTFKTNYNVSSADTILCAMGLSDYDNPTSINAYMLTPPFSIADQSQLAVVLKNSADSINYAYIGNYTTTKNFIGAVRYNFPVDSLSRFDFYTIPMDALNSYNTGDAYGNWTTVYKPTSGTGTSSDPYLINTAWQLAWLKAMTVFDKVGNNSDKNQYNIPSKYYKLTTNIFCEPGLNWKPIGNSQVAFNSNFDGGGNTIYGMNITNSDQGHYGLFADADTATISNITVKGTVNMTGGTYVGGIAGTATSSTFTNCNSYVQISSTSSYSGGIVGIGWGNLVFENCTNNANVTESLYVGGIIGGYMASNPGPLNEIPTAKIYKCTNNSTITGTQEGVGGIVGTSQLQVPIGECVNNGAVVGPTDKSNAYVGGIAGNTWPDKIYDCTNNGDITGTAGVTGYILGIRYINGNDTILGLGNKNTGANNTGDYWLGTDSIAAPNISTVATSRYMHH